MCRRPAQGDPLTRYRPYRDMDLIDQWPPPRPPSRLGPTPDPRRLMTPGRPSATKSPSKRETATAIPPRQPNAPHPPDPTQQTKKAATREARAAGGVRGGAPDPGVPGGRPPGQTSRPVAQPTKGWQAAESGSGFQGVVPLGGHRGRWRSHQRWQAAESGSWAYVVSNHGPLPCEGSALPLSYTPAGRSRTRSLAGRSLAGLRAAPRSVGCGAQLTQPGGSGGTAGRSVSAGVSLRVRGMSVPCRTDVPSLVVLWALVGTRRG